jgi:hypothetical protein
MDRIVLDWTVVDADSHVSERNHVFPCGNRHGVTAFEVTTGRASLRLQALCENATAVDPTDFEAPPPIVRTITAGDVVTLETQLIQVASGACP